MSAIYDVFISYAEEDGDWVRGYLIDALEAAGVRYCSEEDFGLGVPWIAEFERSVKQSRRTLLILSPAYMDRKNLEFVELLAQFYGLETGTWPVIPLTLHPVKIPLKLKQLKGLDATQPDSRTQVVERLCLTLGQKVPGLTPKPECPYPGMVPFKEEDRDRFFGREAEVEELLEKLRLSPFVTVIGPSGSGKSSLVYAGLIPQLRLTRRFRSGEWLILSMRPGKTPLTFLKTLLEGDVENAPQTVASRLQQHQAQQLLLLVDQFEETFTLADGAEALPFQESILTLIDTPSCYIVLTVRADFYAELMQSPLWHKIKRHRVEVVPLGDEGLRQAIRKPAENVDVMVESALVERLVTDAAGEPGVLPFVQETLRFLWEKLERRYLPLTAYQQLVLSRKTYGGMGSEKLTGLQVAMERQADAAIADFTDEQIAIARRIFLRLIQFGQGRADTRRQLRVEALRASGDRDEVFEATFQHLVSYRLLTSSAEEGDCRKADIAHEALISGWSELKTWIAERREAEQTRRQLAAKTAEWIRLEGKGGLLDEVELAEAERWLSNPDAIELGVGEKLQDFVRASRTAIELEKQKEKEAQQREYDLLQERLEQEKIAKENERKARKATQKTFRVTVILLAFAAVFATVAGWQWRQSERGEIIAKVERAKAEFAQNRDTFDALLLALEAGEQFKRSIWWRNDADLKAEVMEALVATVFWTKERDRLVGHTSFVQSIAFSPDGTLLASGGYDNIIRLWNISSRDEEPLELIGHEEAVMAVDFSKENRIASVSQDQTLKLWDKNGKEITEVQHDDIIYSVRFSPDSQFVATGDNQGKIKLCTLDGECTTSPPAHQGAVSGVSFSSEGNFLISVSVDQTIILWEWTRDLQLKPRPSIFAHNDRILGVDFSPTKDNLFATGSKDGVVKLWKLENELVKIVPVRSLRSRDRERYYSVRFSQDGNQLAGGTYEGSIYIWDRNQDWVEIERLKGHRLIVYSLDFNAQGQIASASKDLTIKLWQPTNSLVRVFKGHESSINSVDFSPDGQTFVTASEDTSIKLWSSSGSLLETLQGHTARVNQVVFALDGNMIASVSGNEKTFRLWKVVDDPGLNKYWKNIKTHDININNTGDINIANIDTFSSEFGLWAIGGADGMVRFFPEIVDSFSAHQQQIRSLSFSPETQILATTGDDATIKLWTLKDDQGKLLNTLSKHHGAIYDVSFNTDGTKIATASGDTTAKLWTQKGNESQVFEGHEASVNRSKLSPDQQVMATASDDKTIKIWNLNGNLLVTLRGHENSVNSIEFNPRDSNQILSGGSDNTAILWNLRDAKDLDALLSKGCNMIDNYIEQNRDSLSLSQRICL